MPEKDAGQGFVDAFAEEGAGFAEAREAADRLGIVPVSPAVGALLAVAAAGRPAETVLEIGTGSGVSGLWLLRGSPAAVLTSIDADLDHHQVARHVFTAAGVPARRLRLITGRAADVLPRMNEDSYDVVLVDGDPLTVVDDLTAALKAVRPGGVVLVPHALGRVPNPVRRDRVTVAMREALRQVRERDDVLAALSPAGDGLLLAVRMEDGERTGPRGG